MLLIKNAKQVVTVCEQKEKVLYGEDAKKVKVCDSSDNQGYSIVVDNSGKIEAIGLDDEIIKKYDHVTFNKEINACGKCILPGLIDGHTHPVWVGDRVHEFAMKLEGATYMDIHKAGGGIYFTVKSVHEATEDELYHSFLKRLKAMSKCGTTTIEAKSGYGLDAENEIKMLKVIERARKEISFMDISVTYCGGHAIPKGKTMEEATQDIVENQIPQIVNLMNDGKIHVDNIDVFYETGVFDKESTKKILLAGKNVGMNINFHGDELNSNQSGKLGAEVGALAISHLEEIDDEGIILMQKQNIIATLLPTTAYILKLKPPPARKLIEKGVAVALGSDFNPNAYCYSMTTVMHMACCLLRMSMSEALIGATINAAASIGLSDSHGSIEVGKQADFIIIDAPRWEHLIYQFGSHDEIITHVIKRGVVVYAKS
uniref:Probable imidazolonepropionase n=1 Tax=Hydra vulgaris TaxID=6087 RepID=T2M6L2_HYDVU